MKKKVLFTLQWYGIPANLAASANALCDEIIINKLKHNHKYEIHVLSYGLSGFPDNEIIDGVIVHRVKRSWLWDKFIHTRNKDRSLYTRFIYILNRWLMRLRQLCFFFLFPNSEPIYTLRFSKQAVRLHSENKFDLVISEFNGADSLIAGLAVKKSDHNVLYLPICWDSISGGRLARWMSKKLCYKLRRKLEMEVMRYANKAIVMKSSVPFHQKYTYQYEYYKKFIILDVPYLVVPEENKNKTIRNIIETNSTISLLYSGTMGDRNPRYLLKTLDRIGVKIKFLFVTPAQYHMDIQTIQKELSNVNVECRPYMSHSKLTILQLKSDILVNFGVTNANAVSGKIFDYMRLGKPIISTTTYDREACIPYLQKYSQALIIDERKPYQEVATEIKTFIDKINDTPIDMQTIISNFIDNTPEAYTKVIDDLLKYE